MNNSEIIPSCQDELWEWIEEEAKELEVTVDYFIEEFLI